MKKSAIICMLAGSLASVFLAGCKHEPIDPDCAIEPVTYNTYVKEVIASKCIACHAQNSLPPVLETYQDVMVIVNDGRFKNVITGAPGYPAMPYQSDPLPDCHIEKIVAWIQDGAPE